MQAPLSSTTAPPVPKSRLGFLGVTLALLLVAGFLLLHLAHSEKASASAAAASASAAARPVPVTVAEATLKDVPIYLDGLGNATPLSTVTLRSQVDGRLDKVFFKEGQKVKAGEIIAEIDPRPFQIQLLQAQAALARDQAQLENAKVALKRDEAMVADSVIPHQQYDDQQALVNQLGASLKGDQAQIENARLMLDYAHVRAPFAGVTGVRLVDPGNLVHAADPTGLVVITQLDPMAVIFTLPQDDLVRVNRALANGDLPILVSNRDGSQELGSGKLAMVDNQVNQATGTVRLKAVVPNSDKSLWPNQFVKVRLALEVRKNALVIPAPAVQRGPDGALVYVVSANGTADTRKIDVDLIQDNLALVSHGLNAGDRVVVEGQGQLRPHAKVTTREAPQAGDAVAPKSAASSKRVPHPPGP